MPDKREGTGPQYHDLIERLLSASELSLRILVVAAHPDDETIGAGILLSRQPLAQVLHVTDGGAWVPGFVPERFSGRRIEYAEERRRELAAAMALAGLRGEQLFCLGFRDLEAAMGLSPLARRLAGMFEELRPEIVLTHAYEGGHPDHDATAFAVHAGLKLAKYREAHSAVIVEMALYRLQHGGEKIQHVRDFLPSPASPPAIVLKPTPQEILLKQKMLTCFSTQQQILQWLIAPEEEKFRLAPSYNFTQPPHDGPLLYELAGLPIHGERFCELALAAHRELGV